MKTCPENCDASCYRCLRSFKNKFEHSLLDRHVGAELLEYLLVGEHPSFSEDRVRSSTMLLFNDLERQASEAADFSLDVSVKTANSAVTAPILVRAKGKEYIVALSGPLTGEHPIDPAIADYRTDGGPIPIIVENELVVRGNLPAATRTVLQKLGLYSQ
jgi:hypothetical protein